MGSGAIHGAGMSGWGNIMSTTGVSTVTWAAGTQILAVLVVAIVSLTSGVGLFRILRDRHAGPAIPCLRVCVALIILGALFQASSGLALWGGAAWFWVLAAGLLGLLPALAMMALLACWGRMAEPLSPRHLREANQALRQEIETLQGQAAQQARQQKMDALTRLAGNVSHSINNTMQVMGGTLALLAPRVPDDRQAQDLVAMSLDALDRSMRMTGQLLIFAQQPAHWPCPLDVQAFIETLRTDPAMHLRPGMVLVLDDWTGQPQVPLLVDGGEVMMVMTNLVANAQEAMGSTGTLTIELSTYYARDRVDLADGYYLRLTVTDDGKGLAPHLAEQAMEPFVSTKPVGQATGLGLSVVYGIARRGGGTVTLGSMPGEGAKASVYLRLAMVEADMGRGLGQGREDGGEEEGFCEDFEGLRVMLVDDESETRAIVALTLESLGCVVVQAAGAGQALARLEQGAPDLFMLDYAMPGMTGAQLAHALRARDPACRIVFLTGFADRVAIEAVLGRDVVLVHKPASRSQLARALATALA
jgi:signal transduction histidine kinase